jgi:hypothetical protein
VVALKTIGVSLWDGQLRGGVSNAPTMYRSAARPPTASFRELFVEAYGKFAEKCRAFDEPGLAIVAVDANTGRPAGLVRLAARVGRPVSAIVGRHDHCDLYLDNDARLPLRQLAIVLAPVKSWVRGKPEIHYRVFDLRTADGIRDEEGRALRGLRAEGPAILRCGDYALFMLPIGDPTDWPEQASDAWAMLPERVYLDELTHVPGGSLPGLKMPQGGVTATRPSVVYRVAGPRDTSVRLAAGDATGELEITSRDRRVTFAVGEEALRDGVLLGRYARCDAAAGVAEDNSMSRVHLLIVHVDDQLLAIDTASSRGTRVPGNDTDHVRVAVIDRDTELVLGKKTSVRWRWSAS